MARQEASSFTKNKKPFWGYYLGNKKLEKLRKKPVGTNKLPKAMTVNTMASLLFLPLKVTIWIKHMKKTIAARLG